MAAHHFEPVKVYEEASFRGRHNSQTHRADVAACSTEVHGFDNWDRYDRHVKTVELELSPGRVVPGEIWWWEPLLLAIRVLANISTCGRCNIRSGLF